MSAVRIASSQEQQWVALGAAKSDATGGSEDQYGQTSEMKSSQTFLYGGKEENRMNAASLLARLSLGEKRHVRSRSGRYRYQAPYLR